MTLLTEKTEKGHTIGHTDNFLTGLVPNVELPSNETVEVLFTSNSPAGLVGEIVAKNRQVG
jgi:hypothetical protein